MSQRAIRFWHRGKVVEVSGVSPQRTVLQWLREDAHCTGTKEGCGEGDCGACTVVVGSRDDAAPGGVRLEAVNSCIQFMPTLDGKALFSVEDVKLTDGTLHPVQEAMVECHGSQCGFCTPGFIMSLWAHYENNRESRDAAPTRDEITDTLSGNLCRCTGYRPIIDAAQAAWQKPCVKLSRAPLRSTLDELAAQPALEYSDGKQTFFAPRSTDELASLYAAHPDARILAGSTDVGLWVTKQLRQLGDIIYVGAAEDFAQIAVDDKWIEIGAGVSLTDAFDTLTADEPQWTEMAERFASKPIRNAGTLGGNVANGSPIGDSMPALIALGTLVVLQQGERIREMPLEALYLAYQKNAMEKGEFVRALRIPRARPERLFRTWKISKRRDQDISAVCAAFSLTLAEDGTVSAARIAFGGMAATPKRAAAAEAALTGRIFSDESTCDAMRALTGDYQPLADMRASAEYRMQVAQNLLWRLWLDYSSSDAVRIEELNV
ncbi:xanthine dehydrogenase small subunit [Uliginosibacterium sp. H3]|uniref:Xanthine dehydrogenase small subunit n=1 Tax=Uliginosibacterium silvisoli TaxID=3114758 RepID=A0ABU6K1B5_9RHOO|nr:xanthine dehydrogenase small subunit [Uliginosibacterium sp. H3]